MAYREMILAEPDLYTYWPFDETSGTVAQDDGIGGQDGDIHGPTLGVAGPFQSRWDAASKAFDFDGSNDYVDLKDTDVATPLTIECWFYPRGTSDVILARKQNSYGLGHVSAINATIWLSGGATARTVSGGAGGLITTNAWNFGAGRWDGSSLLDVWLDDHVRNNRTDATSINSNNSFLFAGSQSGTGGFFNGRIAHIAIYRAYLSDAKLLRHYEEGMRRITRGPRTPRKRRQVGAAWS